MATYDRHIVILVTEKAPAFDPSCASRQRAVLLPPPGERLGSHGGMGTSHRRLTDGWDGTGLGRPYRTPDEP
jgi:hypothetical protein